jgi:hypothetical protein
MRFESFESRAAPVISIQSVASLRAAWIADPGGNPVQIVMRQAGPPPPA